MLPENANQTIERQLGPQVLHPMSQIKPAGRPAWPLRLRSLYPAGKRLSPAEVKRSIAHAPQCQKTKKPICWDAACHIGCQRSSCPHAHEPLPSLSRLDYTVAMQVLRRGGLKNGPKVNPKDVDGRVAQLRAQAKEEQASKVDPGDTARGKAKAKAKAKEKAGWSRNKRCRSGKEVRRVEVRRYTCLSLHGPRRCPQKGKGDVGVPPCSSATATCQTVCPRGPTMPKRTAPPDMGAPPPGPSPGDTAPEGDDDDVDLDEDELEEVAQISRGACEDLIQVSKEPSSRTSRTPRMRSWVDYSPTLSGDPPRSETAVLGRVPQTPK